MASPTAESSCQNCCLKSCIQNPETHSIAENDGRVEVRAFEAKSQRDKLVSWKRGGDAIFHRQCWGALLCSVKGVMATDTPFTLSDEERSMILECKKTAEYHDSDAQLQQKAAGIANILKNSPYCIGFTGAGISTAAGIGDFRGKDGKWTNRDKTKIYGSKAAKSKAGGHVLEQLRPTYTHEALVKLMEMGLLKYLISQNTDGLHRLSGIPEDKISELHGNSFIEKCESCDARYVRNWACRTNRESHPPKKCSKCRLDHRTGRRCTRKDCNNYLMNTIINFGDYLESDILRSAQHHAAKADTVLTLGSTLRVSPANDLVVMGQEPHRIIICNRQTTPYDSDCDNKGDDGKSLGSRFFGDCDRLMREVMKCVLTETQLKEWEDGREARMVEYGLKRSSVK